MHNYFESIEYPLFTAGFDYFRLAPEKWELMLTRLVQLGIRGVVVTVPWGFHQPKAGLVDFSGHSSSRHDLLTVLKLCAALKLTCLLKPGPVYPAQTQLVNQGRPGWLKAQPDMFDDEFATAFAGWLHTFSQHIAAYQYPNGPITGLILDFDVNENEGVYNSHLKQVRWPIWLRKRYPSIAALNDAYGSVFQNVNDVVFPENVPEIGDDLSPLIQDAQQFMQESRQDAAQPVMALLQNQGWQIPIFPFSTEFPTIYDFDPDVETGHPSEERRSSVINLPHPICIDPNPYDISTTPLGESGAPIAPDGTLRRCSWPIREAAWRSGWSASTEDSDPLLVLPVDNGGVILAGQDSEIKLPVPKETRPQAYRLLTSGRLQPSAPRIKTSRGKLRGHYYVSDEMGDTDIIFYMNDPEQPLAEELAYYLQTHLTARRSALAHWGKQAAQLAEGLSARPEKTTRSKTGGYTSYTLDEARRGLREAEAALKKAVSSIGSLSSGLETVVGKQNVETVTALVPPLPISAYAFEGETRELMLSIAQVCREIVAAIKPTADDLKNLSQADTLTIAEYQQGHTKAIETAIQAQNMALPLIANMREAMANEQLPLVTWRVHQQLQAIATALQWGVLAG
jgi:hypothetical protein